MGPDFNFHVLIVRLQDVFECSPRERPEMGLKQSENWNQITDGVVSDKLRIVVFFVWILLYASLQFWCLYNMAACYTIEESYDNPGDCTTVWRYFVWLYSCVGHGKFLDTIGNIF